MRLFMAFLLKKELEANKMYFEKQPQKWFFFSTNECYKAARKTRTFSVYKNVFLIRLSINLAQCAFISLANAKILLRRHTSS